MPTFADTTAVVVTRGDVDLQPTLAALRPYKNLIVWDNSMGEDMKVFGRYVAARDAPTQYVYVQDDDFVFTEHEALLAAYEIGKVTTNMDPGWASWYPDSGMVGKGAVFSKHLIIEPFRRYIEWHPLDDFALLYADFIFMGLTPVKHVDLGAEQLAWGTGSTRMNGRPAFEAEKREMLERVCRIREERA